MCLHWDTLRIKLIDKVWVFILLNRINPTCYTSVCEKMKYFYHGINCYFSINWHKIAHVLTKAPCSNLMTADTTEATTTMMWCGDICRDIIWYQQHIATSARHASINHPGDIVQSSFRLNYTIQTIYLKAQCFKSV